MICRAGTATLRYGYSVQFGNTKLQTNYHIAKLLIKIYKLFSHLSHPKAEYLAPEVELPGAYLVIDATDESCQCVFMQTVAVDAKYCTGLRDIIPSVGIYDRACRNYHLPPPFFWISAEMSFVLSLMT